MIRRIQRLSIRGCVVAAFVLNAILAPELADASPAAPPTTASETEEIDPAAAMYAEDYGVSVAEAIGCIAAQPSLSAIAANVRNATGDRLGGVWVDQPSFSVTVRLTRGRELRISRRW